MHQQNHVLVGRPIGRVESMELEVDGTKLDNFGPGTLYHSRVLEIAEAIRAGHVEGEVYSDGEVWASAASLEEFYADTKAEA